MQMSYISGKPILGGFLVGPFQHMQMLLSSHSYRTYAYLRTRYGWMPRYSQINISLNGSLFSIPDMASFLSMYEEIFIHEIYKLPAKEKEIRILDLGANIGLSAVYFKRSYPLAKVVAYEADPTIYKHLEKNVSGFSGIEIHNAAIWDSDGTLFFKPEGADGGRVTSSEPNAESVTATDIRKVLKGESFNLIKMDIEGAESVVLPACEGLLMNTQYLFCEYHNFHAEEQKLDVLLAFLRKEGFRYIIQSINKTIQPFVKRNVINGFDMQLNIFAWKSE